jgi:hypothetical protein
MLRTERADASDDEGLQTIVADLEERGGQKAK